MLTPRQIEQVAEEITEIYSEIETSCIKSIAYRISRGQKIKSIDAWKTAKLGEIGKLNKEITIEISKESRKTVREVESLVKKALRASGLADDRVFKALRAGVTDFTSSEGFKRILSVTTANARKGLNLTNTKALQASIKAYKIAINRAYIKAASGLTNIEEAVRDACRELGGSGIILEYKGTNGRISRCSLDASIRRDLVTTINQAGMALTEERCGELGWDLVETSWHLGARPEHEKWQGQVFSLHGKTKGYRTLAEATGYGQVDGLGGINCRHSFRPYYEGAQKDESKVSAEENKKQYELQQRQRYYERTLRNMKRESVALEANGTQEALKEAKVIRNRIRSKSSEYASFLDSHHLTRLRFREVI
ncbi:MAG: phage minor capsid protein [Sphaerochaeta sp.]